MAVQAAYLENGVWMTRDIEISELLARNRARRLEPPQKLEPPKPKIGILSQTVIPSPTIQWVLPARLRSRRRNDIVFVSQRSIMLKEAIMGFCLEDVAIQSEFDANILAANVINACPELSWEAQMRLRANGDMTSGSSNAGNMLPSQILVLTLESKELVFLYYYSDIASKKGRFVHFRRPLPSDVSILERFGRHVATDPRSRAIAVAAPADFFGIFTLRSSEVLRSQIAEGNLDPISEERFFRVNGEILFMEYLYPRTEDGDRIILLLLVAKDQSIQAMCYDWEASESLRQTDPRVTVRPLAVDDRLPNILVPLTKATAFMVVTTTAMIVYKNFLDESMEPPSRHSTPSQDPQLCRSPLWTRWARPFRNWEYNQTHDQIYICREDGWLTYLEIDKMAEIEIETSLGELGCNVDGVFGILDIDFEGGDFLIAGGNMGDGALFVQKPRQSPKCVQKFLNWAPVLDSIVVDSSIRGSERTSGSGSSESVANDRIFTCSGSAIGSGAITQHRYGIEAQIGLMFPLPEDLLSTRSIWALPRDTDGGICLLVSDPISSTLLDVPLDATEEVYATDSSEISLNFSAQTLAFGCTSEGIIVQVTNNSIHLTTLDPSFASFAFRYSDDQSIIATVINSQCGLVAVAVRAQRETLIHLGRVLSANRTLGIATIGCPIQINYEPVCLLVEDFELSVFLFVGTSGGRLIVYRVENDGLGLLAEYEIHLNEEGVSKAIDSMARITTINDDNNLKKSTLFCGLRSGTLIPFEILVKETDGILSIGLKQGSSRKLGQTAVMLSGKSPREDFALVTCGNRFWHVTHAIDSCSLDYVHKNVWITDQNNPSYFQKCIDVFALIDVRPNVRSNSLSGSLVCISEGELLICSLEQHAKPIPQKIDLPGSANRATYSRHLKSLVVAYTTEEIKRDTTEVKRHIRPHIEFIDPDVRNSQFTVPDVSAEDGQVTPTLWRPSGASGERITCILDWTPKRDGKEYHFILIGTSRRHQHDNGRVIFLQARRKADNPKQIECSVKHIHKFEGPVRALAAYDDFTLIVASGYDVIPLEPKFSERRWVPGARYNLASPATSITIRGPYLYVSTARDSLIVLKVVDNRLVLYAHDRVKREGLSHYHIGGDAKLTLTSSRGGTISVLTEMGITDNDKLLRPALAEAHLPWSVIRLNPSSIPPPSSLPSSTAIYGTTMDGSVYRFLTLTENEWRLLRFLQNICTVDPMVCPSTYVRRRQRTPADTEPACTKPSHMHVDGDILVRLLACGSSHLQQMLAVSETSQSPGEYQLLSSCGMKRLEELSLEVLGKQQDPVKEVMRWLGNLLSFEI